MAYSQPKPKKKEEKQTYEIEESEYNLEPRYDSRGSFYGKAKVVQQGNRKTLVSYQTDVAKIENGKAIVNGHYSQTTMRHIKEFLKQNGFFADNTKQILKDYGVKE